MEKFFYYDENYAKKAEWCNENDHHIKEIERDQNGRRFIIVKNEEIDPKVILREQREIECFSIINRGMLWYQSLTVEEYAQLKEWYKLWLDVTQSMITPQKPLWLK